MDSSGKENGSLKAPRTEKAQHAVKSDPVKNSAVDVLSAA